MQKYELFRLENVISTSKQLCEKVKNEVLVLENIAEIQAKIDTHSDIQSWRQGT